MIIFNSIKAGLSAGANTVANIFSANANFIRQVFH